MIPGLVYLIISGILLGLLQVLMKAALQNHSPYSLLLVSSLTAASCAFLLCWHHKFRINWKDWKNYLIIGILVSGITLILELIGLSKTSVQNAGVLLATSVVFTLLFSRMLVKEQISLTTYFMIPVALVGAWLISTSGKMILPNFGDLFILTAAIIYGFVNGYIKKTLHDAASWEITVTRLLFGAPVILVSVFLLAPSAYSQISTALPWGILIGIAIFTTIFLVHRTIDKEGPSKFALFNLLAPVVALLGGRFFNESLSLIQIFGVILVFIPLGFVVIRK